MNTFITRYAVSAVTAAVVGVCSFSVYLTKLKFGKKVETVTEIEDISEEEIEPDTEYEEED